MESTNLELSIQNVLYSTNFELSIHNVCIFPIVTGQIIVHLSSKCKKKDIQVRL